MSLLFPLFQLLVSLADQVAFAEFFVSFKQWKGKSTTMLIHCSPWPRMTFTIRTHFDVDDER
jgi:hypothetical protein